MNPRLVAICAFIASWYCAPAQSIPLATAAAPLQRIGMEELCVTNGVVSVLPDGRLAIDTPSARGVVRVATAQTAEIRFRYVGPTPSSKPLASGEVRRQIGLKLRAQDTCNLLYAMWHLEPDARIAVSLKRNPGKHTHEACGARGYVNRKPRTGVAVPKVLPGESHALRADLHGTNLTLTADGRVVWEGTVGDEIAEVEGPVGFRTDNARFEFEFAAGKADPGTQSNTLDQRVNRCLPSAGD